MASSEAGVCKVTVWQTHLECLSDYQAHPITFDWFDIEAFDRGVNDRRARLGNSVIQLLHEHYQRTQEYREREEKVPRPAPPSLSGQGNRGPKRIIHS